MNRQRNGKLTECAQKLRRDMTKEERHLWYDFLKQMPMNFKRQKVIGSYIVDFYCAAGKLAIELDGSQHYDDEGKAKDAVRDAFLESRRITVLRYCDLDVNRNFEGVCEDIMRHLRKN